MSAKSGNQKQDDELQQVILPRIPRPPTREVEAAKRDIPKALADDGRDFDRFGVSAPTLAHWLCEGWHRRRNAAEWAIADFIRDDFLIPRKIDPPPPNWQADRNFQVFPTPALWEWWEGRGRHGKPRQKRGGRKPLEESNPLKFQVYERIQREHEPGADYADTVDRLKADMDFADQLRDAGLKKLDTALVRTALAFFDQRKRDAARKKQETRKP
jgi:hypothetical protein